MSERIRVGSIKTGGGRVMIIDPAHIGPDFWENNAESIKRMRESGDFDLSFPGACAEIPVRAAEMLGVLAAICDTGSGDGSHDVYVTIESDGTVSKIEVEIG